ncbi:hypothetical protein Tco_0180010 [Tanacetum coccineum]
MWKLGIRANVKGKLIDMHYSSDGKVNSILDMSWRTVIPYLLPDLCWGSGAPASYKDILNLKMASECKVEPIKEEEERAPEEEGGIGDIAAVTFVYKCSASRGVWLPLLQHSSERKDRPELGIEFDELATGAFGMPIEIRVLGQQEYATNMADWTSEISSFKKFATSLQKILTAQEDARLRIVTVSETGDGAVDGDEDGDYEKILLL